MEIELKFISAACINNHIKKHHLPVHILVLNSIMLFDTPASKAITDVNSEQLESMKYPITQPRTTGIQ